MRSRVVAVAVLIGAGQLGISAQAPTFRSATELVGLNVTVVDRNHHPVAGLTQDTFQVFEDGVPQTLSFFAPGELPLDVILLLDTSASMSVAMPLVQQAAMRFARALRPDDRASVLGISSGLRVLQPMTSDVASIDQAIRSTRAAGTTPLYPSIYTALLELAKLREAQRLEPRRQALVVLSDGRDTTRQVAFDDLLTTARRHVVPIYTIAPRSTKAMKRTYELLFGETTHLQDFELRKLASETGGRSFFPIAEQELTGAYGDIAGELSQQYSLGYQSSNQSRDGGFRRIALRVAVAGVQWRTRAGYLADRAPAGNGAE